MLKEDINKVIKSLKETEEFYTIKTGEDEETGQISWDVHYKPDLPNLYKDIKDIVGRLEKLQNKNQTEETETILKISKELKTKFLRILKKQLSIEEQSSTSQGGASMGAGSGPQYATPKAFKKESNSKKDKNIYYYNMGYKKVPSKIKGSGLEVKQLYEGEYNEFQKGRIDIFEKIENELNDLPPLISNAKNKTVEYYSANPGSYAIINSTDLILEYIKDIKTLLKGEQ
tara:strand:- start:1979 stop:2665 length:687 start_codon:yes stop_codon:yes gene_type:complete